MVGKNSQIHLILETNFKNKLKAEAKDNEISLSELCRRKLRQNSQLTKIELMVEKIAKKIK